MISPYHPELYTWLRVVKIRLAQVVNFRLTFRPFLMANFGTANRYSSSRVSGSIICLLFGLVSEYDRLYSQSQ